MDATTHNSSGTYKYKVTACPVTKYSYNGTESIASDSSNSLHIKFKFKVYLVRVSSYNSNNDNNYIAIEDKVRTKKLKVKNTVSWQDLTSDDGSPNSNSWIKISEIINHVFYLCRLPQETLHWVDHQNPTMITSLESRNQLITRVLQAAQSMAYLPEPIHHGDSNCRRQLNLCIRKEIYLDHDRFVTRLNQSQLYYKMRKVLHTCLTRLQPPLETESVRRELVARLQDNGIRNELRESSIDRVTNWLMMLVHARSAESMQHNEYITTPAAEDVINSLQSVILDLEEVCAVCLDIMTEGDVASQLPCSHLYHPICVMEWLNRCNLCPMCRFPLPTQ